jgi:hypothetical protein
MAAEPRLIAIIRRLADLQALPDWLPSETQEINRLRAELFEGWPEVSAALACAYLQAAAGDAL